MRGLPSSFLTHSLCLSFSPIVIKIVGTAVNTHTHTPITPITHAPYVHSEAGSMETGRRLEKYYVPDDDGSIVVGCRRVQKYDPLDLNPRLCVDLGIDDRHDRLGDGKARRMASGVPRPVLNPVPSE